MQTGQVSLGIKKNVVMDYKGWYIIFHFIITDEAGIISADVKLFYYFIISYPSYWDNNGTELGQFHLK